MAVSTNAVVTPQTPNAGAMGVLLSAAMTSTKAFEGTDTAGTALGLVFTAGSNGARVDKVVAKYSGTTGAAPSGTSTATVLRVFLNNGSANTTATNNILIGDIDMPAKAYSNSASMDTLTLYLNVSIPAGYKIYVGMATAIAGTNCAASVSCFGADY